MNCVYIVSGIPEKKHSWIRCEKQAIYLYRPENSSPEDFISWNVKIPWCKEHALKCEIPLQKLESI